MINLRAASTSSGFFLILIVISTIGLIRMYIKNRKLERAKNDNNQYYVDAEGNKYIYEKNEDEKINN
jgi:cell division protein FtsL